MFPLLFAFTMFDRINLHLFAQFGHLERKRPVVLAAIGEALSEWRMCRIYVSDSQTWVSMAQASPKAYVGTRNTSSLQFEPGYAKPVPLAVKLFDYNSWIAESITCTSPVAVRGQLAPTNSIDRI